MEKSKRYHDTKFPFIAIESAHNRFLEWAEASESNVRFQHLRAGRDDETWMYDSRAEFGGAYPKCTFFMFDQTLPNGRFSMEGSERSVKLTVSLQTRGNIEDVFNVLERHLNESSIIVSEEIHIFIGHGKDPQWRLLHEHLRDQHGFNVQAYEVGPRAGLSIKEVLQNMLDASSFALLLLTAEDLHADGELHARENVIHELGLFQGRLGFLRAIALVEDGVREFSNILGINQIRFPKGMVRSTFGDVLATIRREFEIK